MAERESPPSLHANGAATAGVVQGWSFSRLSRRRCTDAVPVMLPVAVWCDNVALSNYNKVTARQIRLCFGVLSINKMVLADDVIVVTLGSLMYHPKHVLKTSKLLWKHWMSRILDVNIWCKYTCRFLVHTRTKKRLIIFVIQEHYASPPCTLFAPAIRSLEYTSYCRK